MVIGIESGMSGALKIEKSSLLAPPSRISGRFGSQVQRMLWLPKTSSIRHWSVDVVAVPPYRLRLRYFPPSSSNVVTRTDEPASSPRNTSAPPASEEMVEAADAVAGASAHTAAAAVRRRVMREEVMERTLRPAR